MRRYRRAWMCLVTVGALVACAVCAAEDPPPAPDEQVLVVRQEYNVIKQDKSGAGGKDTIQVLYLAKDFIRIDEYENPADPGPTETTLLDFGHQLIVDLNHRPDQRSVYTETFAHRLERIAQRKKDKQKDLDDMVDGPQKQKVARLWRGLLDDGRVYQLRTPREGEHKTLAGVECTAVEVVDSKDPNYLALRMYVHPTERLPYDSAEMLYLLQILGGTLRDFLNANPAQFRQLPLETELDLALGGHLHATVLEVKKTPRAELARNFFGVPEGYKVKGTGPVNPQPD